MFGTHIIRGVIPALPRELRVRGVSELLRFGSREVIVVVPRLLATPIKEAPEVVRDEARVTTVTVTLETETRPPLVPEAPWLQRSAVLPLPLPHIRPAPVEAGYRAGPCEAGGVASRPFLPILFTSWPLQSPP